MKKILLTIPLAIIAIAIARPAFAAENVTVCLAIATDPAQACRAGRWLYINRTALPDHDSPAILFVKNFIRF